MLQSRGGILPATPLVWRRTASLSTPCYGRPSKACSVIKRTFQSAGEHATVIVASFNRSNSIGEDISVTARLLTESALKKLARYDTPTICNVMELFEIRPNTAGYMDGRIQAA